MASYEVDASLAESAGVRHGSHRTEILTAPAEFVKSNRTIGPPSGHKERQGPPANHAISTEFAFGHRTLMCCSSRPIIMNRLIVR